MRLVGCQVLSQAAARAGEVAWRLSALRREVEIAKWADADDFTSRYPRSVDHGGGRFSLPIDDTVEVLISICFNTGIFAFREVRAGRQPQSAA